MCILRRVIAACLVLALACSLELASAQQPVTERVSVDSAGMEGNNVSQAPSMSPNGQFIVFWSSASNLVPNDTNATWDAFLRDRRTGSTERVSVNSSGVEGNSVSGPDGVSADGRFVLLESDSNNLVSNDTNWVRDIFVRDRQTGTTERVSVDSNGVQADDYSSYSSMSSDGRIVAFQSYASNLIPVDANSGLDIFIHDRLTGITEIVSVDSAGQQGNGDSTFPSVSSDGRFVVFTSEATNLAPGDANGLRDVFVRDRQTGVTELVSVDGSGAAADGTSLSGSTAGDGRFVVFSSTAANLVAGDTNGVLDAFVRDRQTGTTELVSVASSGVQADLDAWGLSISADGRFVVIISQADNLVPGDLGGNWNVFLRDRLSGTTTLVSADSNGNHSNGASFQAMTSGDGATISFVSEASNLVPGDSNGMRDVFVHGPSLTLEVDPPQPAAGATLTFTTWTGGAGALSLLAIVAIDQTPTFISALFSAFDGAGEWIYAPSVPSGLTGYTFTFESFGFLASGRVGFSNQCSVAFQ